MEMLPQHDENCDLSTVQTLRKLTRLPVAHKWRELGLELGVPVSELNIIQENNQGAVDPCRKNLADMFEWWIDNQKDASYGMVEEALWILKKRTFRRYGAAIIVCLLAIATLVTVFPFLFKSEIRCGHLLDPENGWVNITGRDPGSWAEYHCNHWYEHQGRKKRLCQEDGTWSDQAPECLETPIIEYRRILQGHYKVLKITDPDQWLKVKMPFINLTLLDQTELSPWDSIDKYTVPDSFDKHLETLRFSKKIMNYDGLVSRVTGGRRILMEGRPGAGKSTLLRQIAKQWGHQTELTDFALLILVQLGRDVDTPILNLTALLELHPYSYQYTDRVEGMLRRTGGKDICFVIDGFDEYIPAANPIKNDFVYRLVRREELPWSAVIVTSRPNASYSLRDHFDQNVEVFGFQSSQVHEYVKEFYSGDESKVQQFQGYLDEHINVKHMCYLPLHLTMILYYGKHAMLPDTESEMYKVFVLLTFTHYQFKLYHEEEEVEVEEFELLKRDVYELFLNICRLAMDGISQRVQYFLESDISSTVPTEIRLDTLGIFAIDRQRSKLQTVTKYTFTHGTFQEFLTAYYITTLPPDKQLAMIQESYSYPFKIVWKFFFGLVQEKNSSAALQLFSEFVAINNVTENGRLLLLRCAYELQTVGSAEILAPALQYSIDFDKYSSPTPLFPQLVPTAYPTLTPYECIAVGYTLRMGSHLFSDLILDGHRISPNVEVCLGYIQNEALNGDVVLSGITHFKLAGFSHILESEHFNITEWLIRLPNLQRFVFPSHLANHPQEMEVEGFSHCPRLEYLDVSRNELSEASTAKLIRMLKYLKHLQHLDLSGNYLGDGGLLLLSNKLQKLTKLRNLRLCDISVSDSVKSTLRKTMRENHKGSHMCIDWCDGVVDCYQEQLPLETKQDTQELCYFTHRDVLLKECGVHKYVYRVSEIDETEYS